MIIVLFDTEKVLHLNEDENHISFSIRKYETEHTGKFIDSVDVKKEDVKKMCKALLSILND